MMSSVCTFHYKFIEQNDKHRFILVLCKNLYNNSVLNRENLRHRAGYSLENHCNLESNVNNLYQRFTPRPRLY